MSRDRIRRVGCIGFFALTILLYFLFPISKSANPAEEQIRSALPRLTGSVAILFAVLGERIRLVRRPAARDLGILLPALLVALDPLVQDVLYEYR